MLNPKLLRTRQKLLEKDILEKVNINGSMLESLLITELSVNDSMREHGFISATIQNLYDEGRLHYNKSSRGNIVSSLHTRH